MQSDFVINAIRGRYVLCRSLCVCRESIPEAIQSESFREFPYAYKLFIVVLLNPTAKQFLTISNFHLHNNISTQK